MNGLVLKFRREAEGKPEEEGKSSCLDEIKALARRATNEEVDGVFLAVSNGGRIIEEVFLGDFQSEAPLVSALGSRLAQRGRR